MTGKYEKSWSTTTTKDNEDYHHAKNNTQHYNLGRNRPRKMAKQTHQTQPTTNNILHRKLPLWHKKTRPFHAHTKRISHIYLHNHDTKPQKIHNKKKRGTRTMRCAKCPKTAKYAYTKNGITLHYCSFECAKEDILPTLQ